MKMSLPLHWKILFGLWSIQGLVALVWLLILPTDAEDPLAFGFSSARLALIGIALLPAVLFAFLSIKYDALNEQPAWSRLKQNAMFWDVIYIVSLSIAFVVFCAIVMFNLLHDISAYSAYALRLSPLLLWLGFSTSEFALFIGWNRYEQAKNILDMFLPVLRRVIPVLGVLCLVGLLVAVTGIGVTPDDNWGDPPVPFFEWQILLTLLVIGFVALLPRTGFTIIDKWGPILIYLFTLILWLSQPINPAYAATPPRAPNFEIYPFSDPQFYAQYAQSALVGDGFSWPEVPTRPFYVAILTWLHLFGDQNYNHVIVLQTLILAFFPVLLYLLGKEVGGWPLGLGLSLLTVFRDINSNDAVFLANNVTYSKVFLSELPAALFISLAVLLSFFWMRMENRPGWYPLLIGGVLGVASLIRLQSVILAFVVMLLAFFTIPDRKQWLRGVLLMTVGLTITISPWMARNYFAAGGLVLDNPISQTMTMARRWSGNLGNDILPRLPNESDAQYSNRLTRMALESFKQNPGFILRTAANHFINSEIASLLAFPIRDEILSPSEILLPQHAFWKTPLIIKQAPFFMANLLLFVLGVTAAWRRLQLAGLLPLGLGLAYNLWSALFFSSGERFIVPLDWSVYLYQLLGLLILCGLILSFTQIGGERVANWMQPPVYKNVSPPFSLTSNRRGLILSFLLVLCLGGFLPFTEFSFPQKYPPKPQTEIMEQIGQTVRPGELALYGRAVYPRYYESGDGEPETAKLGYGPAEQARLVFYLVGPNNGLVIFELEHAPMFFPHASDVFMVGAKADGYFSPRVVMVIKDSHTEIYEIEQ